MKYIFLIALICTACAPPLNYITKHGLRVRIADGVQQTQTEVESATEAVVQSLGDRWFGGTKQTRDWLWGLSVWVDNGSVPCPGQGKDDRCYGLASEYGIRYQWFPCIAQSAFIHELIHYLMMRNNGWYDYEHVSYEIWGVNGVESDARMASCYESCPSICK